MNWLTIAVVLYGLAVAGGGIMGYVSKGSAMSAMAGGGAGLVLLGLAAFSKSNPKAAFGLTALVAVGLIGMFIYRYIKTQSPMPAFGVIGLSLVMLVLLIFGHFMARQPAEPV